MIIDAQRAGPSTGMPTKTEQSDLNHAVYGSHGEAPRVVIAPTTVDDCLLCTVDAFNVAETYQVPVILLSDQSLWHRLETVERPISLKIDSREPRHRGRRRRPSNGAVGRALPALRADRVGRLADGDPRHVRAHMSQPASSTTSWVTRPTRRRHAPGDAGQALAEARPAGANGRVTVTGPEKAQIGILGWGSTEGAAVEAAEMLARSRRHAPPRSTRASSARCPVDVSSEWAEGMDVDRRARGQLHRSVRAHGARRLRDSGDHAERRSPASRSPPKQIADFIIENVKTPRPAA